MFDEETANGRYAAIGFVTPRSSAASLHVSCVLSTLFLVCIAIMQKGGE